VIVTAALCWYDEPVELLDACVRGLAGVADRIVAVDGAYRRFPHTTFISPPEQAEVIRSAARDIRIECSVIIPEREWAGQVEKRSRLLAEAAKDTDWIMVVDADHIVHADTAAARIELGNYGPDVDVISVPMFTILNADRSMLRSAATGWHRDTAGRSIDVAHLFRALPDLHVERFHWWYKATKDGQPVWLWYGEGIPQDGTVITPTRMRSVYGIEHLCLLRDEKHILANRAFCNDREMVVNLTGQEDDVPGLPVPVYDYERVPY
jgi:hypothetical protein